MLAFLSVFAIWIERQALNTDDWVHTSDKLIQNEKIREAVGDYLVDQLYENVDVEKELEDILPGETKQLAGPVSGGLRQVAGGGAEQVLQSSTARRASGRTPTGPRTNSCSPCWKTRRKRSRPRKAKSPSTSAAWSPTSPTRSGSAASWPKSCRQTPARS